MFELNASMASAISRELNLCALRHQIYSANIANADVQGYERLELAPRASTQMADFIGADMVQADAIVSTHQTVKLDQEMAKLSKNALRYETLLTAYEKMSGILRVAIREGRGE